MPKKIEQGPRHKPKFDEWDTPVGRFASVGFLVCVIFGSYVIGTLLR